MKRSRIRSLLAACGLALATATASAVPVLHINNGVLEGASGVIVNGISYEVAFGDGSCQSLYNGCTDTSLFAFHTQADALTAMTALNDQVWGTTWGAANTKGCEDPGVCATLLVFGLSPDGQFANQLFYFNHANPSNLDYSLVNAVITSYESGINPIANNAIWTLSDVVAPGGTEVPEPASFALAALALGIAGAAGRGRRRPPAVAGL